MKLTPQQLLMPMLIGFSLTGVSVILLYFFTRKDEDEVNDRRKTRIATSRQSEIQMKIPRNSIPAVIGRGGSMIKEIQENTETQIKFSDENDVEATERICIIRGKPESIRLAEAFISNIIRNQPVIETHEMEVAQKHVGKIMGKGGESIKQIQNISSAKVTIDGHIPVKDYDAKRKFIIKGTSQQIATAISLIEEKIQDEMETQKKLESNVRQPRSKKSPSPRNNGFKDNNEENTCEEVKPRETEKPEKSYKYSERTEKPINTAEHFVSSSTELVAETLPIQDNIMEIFVSAMESPSQFFVQVYGPGTLALDDLVEKMSNYYDNEENAESHILKNITVDQMVAAKFGFDSRWYRSEVLSGPDDDGFYQVFFLDFGDRARVSRRNILELRTDFLGFRLQAIECSLADVRPPEGGWSDVACDRFADLTNLAQWKRVFAKIKGYKERPVGYGRSRREGSPIPSLVIYDIVNNKEVDVAKEMISEYLAEPDVLSPASSTISISKRDPDFRKSSSPPSEQHPVQSENTNKVIQEIDLTTPIKGKKKIEEIDLVSPVTNQTAQFISNEKRSFTENGSGDHSRVNRNSKSRSPSNILPAGYSDDSTDSDFELE